MLSTPTQVFSINLLIGPPVKWNDGRRSLIKGVKTKQLCGDVEVWGRRIKNFLRVEVGSHSTSGGTAEAAWED